MEIALAAMGSLWTAGSAAASGITGALGLGGAAAGTAGAAAAGGGLGSTALTILQGFAGATSLLAGLNASNQEADALIAKSTEATTEAIREEAAGAKRVTELKREMLKVMGENDVAFAAGGVDISAGVAADTRAETRKRGSREITIDRADTDAKAAALRARALGYRRAARSRREGGVLGAIAGGAKLGFDIANRG